ncbi:MAG: ATP-binding protein [Thermoguttaceae bacterium]|jgi:Cdc6-like AAA superfamily ATPase
MADEFNDFESISLSLSRVFTPATAINSEDLFYGRINQVRAVVDAINQVGQHAILYGERGVGKTSLGRILPTKLRGREMVPIIALMITCDSGDNFSTIWSKVFSEIPNEFVDIENSNVENTSQFIDITPHDVRKRIEPLTGKGIVCVILDEFDKIQDENARTLIADTIKLFSDHAVNATIIIIGVADDLTGLIREHHSIERCLAQIPMPRMAGKELEDIVLGGLKKVGMTIEKQCLWEITGLSKGLPHYTHLLALNASRQALDEKLLEIAPTHIRNAIQSALKQVQESIRNNYDQATYSSRKGTLHTQVLLACALAEADEFGRFQPLDVCDPLNNIIPGSRSFTTDRFASHLKAFCDPDRGAILIRIGAEYRWRYRFSNPLMQPYVIMRGIEHGLISDEKLKEITSQEERYPLFNKKKGRDGFIP